MVALVETEVFTSAAVLVTFTLIDSVFSYRTLYSSAIGVDCSSCQNSYTFMNYWSTVVLAWFIAFAVPFGKITPALLCLFRVTFEKNSLTHAKIFAAILTWV